MANGKWQMAMASIWRSHLPFAICHLPLAISMALPFAISENLKYWNNPPSYLLKYVSKHALIVHVAAMNQQLNIQTSGQIIPTLSYVRFKQSANKVSWHLHIQTYKLVNSNSGKLYKESFSKVIPQVAAVNLAYKMYVDGLILTKEPNILTTNDDSHQMSIGKPVLQIHDGQKVLQLTFKM
jgi:hypothetical protein